MKKNAPFKPSVTAEREFIRQLRKLAKVSGGIVETRMPTVTHPQDVRNMMQVLEDYSETLTPWAIRQSEKLISQVTRSNKRAYANKSKILGRVFNSEIADKEVGTAASRLMREQVHLIKSIPLEAGKRAQELAMQAVYGGERASSVAEEIRRTTEVTEARATLIGRTETARANAKINQARAESIGSNQYRWHNSGDAAVRDSHKYYKGKRLQGMIFSWDNPPTLDDGMKGHPGTFPNCFPGSIEVNGTPLIEKLYRRRYTGELTTLIFNDGSTLTATPNHPIVGLGEVTAINRFNIGDYVACQPKQAFNTIKPDIESFNITFDKLFNSLNMNPFFTKSRAIAGQFHGDSSNEEVDIINMDRNLIRKSYSMVRKKLFEFDFTQTDILILSNVLQGLSLHAQGFSRNFLASASDMSRLNLKLSILKAHFTPLELFGFALGSYLDVSLDEVLSNNSPRKTKGFGDLIFAYSFLIHGFNFLEVQLNRQAQGSGSFADRRVYSSSPEVYAQEVSGNIQSIGNLDNGLSRQYQLLRVVDKRLCVDTTIDHVYNLQTESGYYNAGGVFASNCRCFAESIFIDE